MKIQMNTTHSSPFNFSNKTALQALWMVMIWALVVISGSYNSLLAQEEWTFDEVLTKAEEQSIFRYQAIADNKIAQSRWAFYKTNLSPGVTLDLLAPNYSKTSREIVQPDGSISFQSVSQNNSSIRLGIQQQIKSTGGTVFLQSQLQRFDDFSLDNNQYNGIPFRIGLSQPLFGFNDLKWASKIEPLALTEADRKYIIDMEDIHLRGTIAFFDLLMAQVNEKIATTNSDVNAKLLEIAKERFDLGKISRNELLQLELEYKSAVKDLSIAAFQVQFSKGALQTFLGGDKTDNIAVLTPNPKENTVDMEMSIAVDQALANRPEIIAFQRQKLEADREINRAKTEYGVKADLFASFGLARGSQKFSDIYSDPISEQQVQLGLSIPILDWGRRKSAVGIARAQKELIEQQIAQDNLDFQNDIVQAVSNWEQLQREVKIQEEIREVSLERFEISRQRYILGAISITDLTIAQREKDQAQRDYVDTLRAYWVTYYQIRKLTGFDFEKEAPITYTF